MSDRWATTTTKLSAAHAKRLSWALKADGHLLAAAVGKDTSPEARKVERLPIAQIPEYLARLILERADPTAAKSMTAWLVRQYGEGKLRLEDLGSAHETLEMFQRYAPKLPEGHRDLGRYQSLAEVWGAVLVLAETEKDRLSSKAQKSLDRDRAYAESRILRQDEDGFTIAVPLTEFAAKWWGKGTRWCTAAEKDNAFLEYHTEAPLVVIVLPWLGARGKFQFWSSKKNAQFMDASDEPITNEVILQNWERFEGLLLHALRLNGCVLGYVPEALRTEELCKVTVHHDGFALEYVPNVLRTQDLCRIALSQNAIALDYVPVKLRTDEMYRIAVAQNGRFLWHVSERLRTEELCKIAVTQNGRALEHVPENLRTEEMCRIAVAQEGLALGYVPWDLRTDEMCRIAVAQAGLALQYVPCVLRTKKVCRIAVAANSIALGYTPKNLRTKVICHIAVAQNGFALGDVPQRLRTEELCGIAVAQNGLALEYVPTALRTEELCRMAVAQSGSALCYLPAALRGDEICSIAVAQEGLALQYVPEYLLTEELCKIAVAQDGEALYWVPNRLRTDEMCRIAVTQNGTALQYVPPYQQPVIKHLARPPSTAWDMSLLDELATFIRVPSSLELSGPRHA